jgi:hypothetical protein
MVVLKKKLGFIVIQKGQAHDLTMLVVSHAFIHSVIKICMDTSSAAVSGTVSAAFHSIRYFASSKRFFTTVASVELRAEDEIRPSVADFPPRWDEIGSRRKRSRNFSLFWITTHLGKFRG